MEPQVSLSSEALLCRDVNPLSDSDCNVIAFSQNHDPPHPAPNEVKKQTRQWAAWTREEEECFFNALRQVGKNFEKITYRVQSKNKDQVRHYYYRLVRRMNKYLGPGLSVDAKNSKDTNAAMLRWWSLLEKFSCKVSKLHLKPRRFKIFLETLEHQLLKDRKRSSRKRPSQGENCSLTAPANISNQSRESGLESHAANLVLLESRNVQKLGTGKGSKVKRNVNIGVNRNSCKADSFAAKTSRQRRKPAATVSTSAYKRWEKAAIAGVSLVADAAEHLERTTIDSEVEHIEGMKDLNAVRIDSSISSPENNVQISGKLKLQLFPIDEGTRRALEMDNHNPHLELTLSTRKKISSVLEHLNRKWGNSSIASGEIMLFPYYAQPETLGCCLKWTHDSVLSAADVYTSVGSPSVFRLRYGWVSSSEFVSATAQVPILSSGMIQNTNRTATNMKDLNRDVVQETALRNDHLYEELHSNRNKDQQVFSAGNILPVPSSTEVRDEILECTAFDKSNNLVESSNGRSTLSHEQREASDEAILVEAKNKELQLREGPSFSAKEWADSLTNISIGDLLSEAPHDVAVNSINTPTASECPQQGPFICDSFDAAIAAHIYRHQNKSTLTPPLPSYTSSILNGEDTCDAFSFRNSFPRKEVNSASDALRQFVRTGQVGSCATVELAKEEVHMAEECDGDEPANHNPMDDGNEDDHIATDDAVDEYLSDPSVVETSANDFNGLTDMFWPDSLGPLDLDLRSCRYHNEDLILSDSLGSLNRLLASSLDAFQNCSLFGLDKKDTPTTTVEVPGTASFSDYKINNSV